MTNLNGATSVFGGATAPLGAAPTQRLVDWAIAQNAQAPAADSAYQAARADLARLASRGDVAGAVLAGLPTTGAGGAFDFGAIDGNGDGVLSGSELAGVGAEARAGWDVDRNGELSRAEAVAGSDTDRALAGDQNRDGYLSGTELSAELAPLAARGADGRLTLTRERMFQARFAALSPAAPVGPAGPAPVGPAPAPYAPAPNAGPGGVTPAPSPYAPAPVGPAPAPAPYAPVGPAPAPAPYAPVGPAPAPAPYAPVGPAPVPAPYAPAPVPGGVTPANYVPGPAPAPLPYAPPAPYTPTVGPAPYLPPPTPAPAPLGPAPLPPAPGPYVPPPAPVAPPPPPLPGPQGPGTVGPLSADDAARIRGDYRTKGSRKPGQEGSLDLLDANGFDAAKMEAFKELVAVNVAAEAVLLQKLSPEQGAAYQRTKLAIAHDPPAQLALQGLLAGGGLTGGDRDAGGRDLLTALDELGRAPVAAGIEQNKLLGDVIQEIFEPTCINQHNRGTCAAASVQIKVADDRPAEYVRLVQGLASPDGQVKLAGGENLARCRGTQNKDNTPRTQSSRLIQAAFMELAEPNCTYNNDTDRHTGGRSFSGLTQKGVDRLLEGVWAQEAKTYERVDNAVLEQVKASLAAGNSVPAGVAWGSGMHARHEVLLRKIENDTVYFDNPWGLQGKMSVRDFMGRRPSVSIPTWKIGA